LTAGAYSRCDVAHACTHTHDTRSTHAHTWQCLRCCRQHNTRRANDATQDNSAAINSIDFHRTHDLLATASGDRSIHVYDTAEAKLLTTVHSHKYGCQLVTWGHAPDKLLFASNKVGAAQRGQRVAGARARVRARCCQGLYLGAGRGGGVLGAQQVCHAVAVACAA
jgi:hypothetical protein